MAAPAGARGYGRDPNLLNPTVPWPRTMTKRQLTQVATLADLILPPTATAPAPSAVGIHDFVDEWISAPYPDQRKDRALILPGLKWLDTQSKTRWRKLFVVLSPEQQIALLGDLATPPSPGGTDMAAVRRFQFLWRFRSISVGAYYSMKRNFAEIGYLGNVASDSFPPMTKEETAFVDQAIAKLGL